MMQSIGDSSRALRDEGHLDLDLGRRAATQATGSLSQHRALCMSIGPRARQRCARTVSAKFSVQHFIFQFYPPTNLHNTPHTIIPIRFFLFLFLLYSPTEMSRAPPASASGQAPAASGQPLPCAPPSARHAPTASTTLSRPSLPSSESGRGGGRFS
jgi:hypothetical protein